MWKAIKWGFGIAIGLALAYVTFWALLIGGFLAILIGSDA